MPAHIYQHKQRAIARAFHVQCPAHGHEPIAAADLAVVTAQNHPASIALQRMAVCSMELAVCSMEQHAGMARHYVCMAAHANKNHVLLLQMVDK